MDFITTLISLVSGVIGGNVAGAAMPSKSLGAIGNSIVGLLGGVGGDYLLKAIGIISAASVAGGPGSSELDIGSILTTIGVSGVSGAALTAIVGLIKGAFNKS